VVTSAEAAKCRTEQVGCEEPYYASISLPQCRLRSEGSCSSWLYPPEVQITQLRGHYVYIIPDFRMEAIKNNDLPLHLTVDLHRLQPYVSFLSSVQFPALSKHFTIFCFSRHLPHRSLIWRGVGPSSISQPLHEAVEPDVMEPNPLHGQIRLILELRHKTMSVASSNDSLSYEITLKSVLR